MPKSDTQFGRERNPMRAGLGPAGETLAPKPTCVRLYAADQPALDALPDRSGFIREAVRAALRTAS